MKFYFEKIKKNYIYDSMKNPSYTIFSVNFKVCNSHFSAKWRDANNLLSIYHNDNLIIQSDSYNNHCNDYINRIKILCKESDQFKKIIQFSLLTNLYQNLCNGQ